MNDAFSHIFKPAFKAHFDPTKYNENGNRIGKKWKRKSRATKFVPRGRSSLLRPDDAAIAVALERNVRRCRNAHARAICRAWLDIFFFMRGLDSRQQTLIMSRLRGGWRPKK